jgi:hypothetical protein
VRSYVGTSASCRGAVPGRPRATPPDARPDGDDGRAPDERGVGGLGNTRSPRLARARMAAGRGR